jgi:hypothetical protein
MRPVRELFGLSIGSGGAVPMQTTAETLPGLIGREPLAAARAFRLPAFPESASDNDLPVSDKQSGERSHEILRRPQPLPKAELVSWRRRCHWEQEGTPKNRCSPITRSNASTLGTDLDDTRSATNRQASFDRGRTEPCPRNPFVPGTPLRGRSAGWGGVGKGRGLSQSVPFDSGPTVRETCTPSAPA